VNFRKYTNKDVQTLLKAIDANLDKKFEITLIGGAAALLAYKATRLTQDIDSFNKIAALESAYEKAKKDTGLEIPLSQAGVADVPYNFEDRLVEYKRLKLKKLIIKIPEIHDFILMKTIRGYEHDLDVIEEISKKNKISKEVLIERFETEMNHVVGNNQMLKLNFAATLSRCFGEDVANNWADKR
jgi:predicted nucleotidyltransferase